MNLKAVLFDLDNTLISFDEIVFFKEYMKKLFVHFADLMTVEDFTNKLLFSTFVMVENNGKQPNVDSFMESFGNEINADKNDVLQRFIYFYEKDFKQFKPLMTPIENTYDVLYYTQQKGLKTVIATNPMFPMNVQEYRINWAGLDNLSFDLITSADNTSFCKPNLDYYRDICEKINVSPGNCLMVGNDSFNDMIASKIGMKTYLTTDSEYISIELSRLLAQKVDLEMPSPDYKGSLSGLTAVIDSLIQT